RGEDQTVRESRWQVLQRVDGDVDTSVQQGLFDFLGEEARALEIVQRTVHLGIALSLDHDDLRADTVRRQAVPHPVSLPARQLAASASRASSAAGISTRAPTSEPPLR